MSLVSAVPRLRSGLVLGLALLAPFTATSASAQTDAGTLPVGSTSRFASPEPRMAIEKAIEDQKARRGWGIASTVVGGGLLIAGIAVAVDDSVDKYNCENSGTSCKKKDSSTPVLLDISGAAFIALGVYNIVDANVQIHRLQRTLRVSYDRPTESMQLGLALAF